MADAAREEIERHLTRAIIGERICDVDVAVHMLLDYIDTKAAPVPSTFIGESGAMEMFRTFVRDNAEALRMVASWGDGECGALHEVLLNELQGKSLFGPLVKQQGSGRAPNDPPVLAPLFPEDGGAEGNA